jgi:AraC-like DNA-binding protein/anti-anti-sigma regulatory factor
MSALVGTKIQIERRDRICLVAVHGSLDRATAAGLAETIGAERAAHPARLVIDMSGVADMEPGAARILAAAARPVRGQCRVIVRSLRPAIRNGPEMAGLDLGGPDPGDAESAALSPGRQEALADTPTGQLIREWRHLRASVEHAIWEGQRARLALASTEDRLAATVAHLLVRRPAASARLTQLGQAARDYAEQLRGYGPPATASPPPAPRAFTANSTMGRAVGFIEERAQDDIAVADIAAAAFVTVRAVQLAFRSHLGVTPLAYLRQVRLEHAHRQLLYADPARTTVTAVAADWRFSNSSRFTAYYRAVYGVAPLQTLRHPPPAS